MKLIMYSAESTLQDINAVEETKHKIDCIKEYAQSVARQALKDAAENATMTFHCGHSKNNTPTKHHQSGADNLQVNKESILNIEIQTP